MSASWRILAWKRYHRTSDHCQKYNSVMKKFDNEIAEKSPSAPGTSSLAVKSKIPRGQAIEDWQLPEALRHKPISEEECRIINVNLAASLVLISNLSHYRNRRGEKLQRVKFYGRIVYSSNVPRDKGKGKRRTTTREKASWWLKDTKFVK